MLLPIQIIGSSMAPTYKDGSYNFINKVAYTRSNPHMGDVIACETDGELILKRIIALPGDSVAIENGIIHINDKPLADNFARIKVPWEMDKMHLRENEFWVIGDNRSNSIFCKVHKSQIWGKIIF
ncbi:MAG: signal peptidase I [Verrucomicrobiales bacterium]